jgi:hypothetical protein
MLALPDENDAAMPLACFLLPRNPTGSRLAALFHSTLSRPEAVQTLDAIHGCMESLIETPSCKSLRPRPICAGRRPLAPPGLKSGQSRRSTGLRGRFLVAYYPQSDIIDRE